MFVIKEKRKKKKMSDIIQFNSHDFVTVERAYKTISSKIEAKSIIEPTDFSETIRKILRN